MISSKARLSALRLRPGDDLYLELDALGRKKPARALAIVTCVGSLMMARIRLAAGQEAVAIEGPHEIVSLVGTLSCDGPHLHICLADARGTCVGGHLQSGSIIYTTTEIVLLEASDLRFDRAMDDSTGYPELRISRKTSRRRPARLRRGRRSGSGGR